MILRNLWHWKTKWAVNHLSKQLQRDPEFRASWHANIAMPIFDHFTPRGVTDRRLVNLNFEIGEANYIADRLMKHLFQA